MEENTGTQTLNISEINNLDFLNLNEDFDNKGFFDQLEEFSLEQSKNNKKDETKRSKENANSLSNESSLASSWNSMYNDELNLFSATSQANSFIPDFNAIKQEPVLASDFDLGEALALNSNLPDLNSSDFGLSEPNNNSNAMNALMKPQTDRFESSAQMNDQRSKKRPRISSAKENVPQTFLEPNLSLLGSLFEPQNSNLAPDSKISAPQKPVLSNETPKDKSKRTTKTATKKKKTPRKKKKDMTPEELKQLEEERTKRRILKNRRTAKLSRQRKQQKKKDLEESLEQLTSESEALEKQKIELSAQNKTLKSEFSALLQMIQATPALAKRFDAISKLAVSQSPNQLLPQPMEAAASVYLLNLLYSLHMSWSQINEPRQTPSISNPLSISVN